MEAAGFEPRLSDEYLKELGRLVVNCGFVEFLLNIHVGKLFEIPGRGRIELIVPLATRRKLEILEGGLGRIPNPQVRALVDEACKLTSPTISMRNDMLHEIWGFSGATGPDPVAAPPKKTIGQRRPNEIGGCADHLAIASRKLVDAITIGAGKVPSGNPERLVIGP